MKKFVLFDFDGVIADSFWPCAEAIKEICPLMTIQEQRDAFNGNVHEGFDVQMKKQHGPPCRHDKEWFETYMPHFEKVLPFDGIIDVIEKLSHEYILIVISSTISSPIQGFLEKFHIGRYFSEVLGADVHTHKDEKIKMVFTKYAAEPEDCVFVTDTLGDMNEAQKVGVGSISVSYGFQERSTLEKGKPFRIVDKAQEIPSAIQDYFRGIA